MKKSVYIAAKNSIKLNFDNLGNRIKDTTSQDTHLCYYIRYAATSTILRSAFLRSAHLERATY